LLDIFASFLSLKPEARLLLCGDGPLRAEIEEKAERLGIKDKVIFRGIVKNVNEYLMAMDVFIFPSIFEGFGISVLEAEAAGLPVVISETIPNEVVLMSNVKRCSLSDAPSKWADVVCRMENTDRQACNQIICDTKYNMSTSVNMIMSLYDNMAKNQK
jgi:glycosyltransferase involved in cell wall biosynthesis